MKLYKPILALSCALLLAGCAEPAGNSETPAAESESTSIVEATPLKKLIEGLAAQNYTAKMTMRSGAEMLGSTTDLSLSPEEFIYLQAEDAGVYYGQVEQGTAAVLFSGADILDAQLLTPAKVGPWNFVYTVADIIGDGSDWALAGEEYTAAEDSDVAAMGAAYLGYDLETVECFNPTLVITEDGADLNYGLGTAGQVAMTVDIEITDIGTTAFDCPADLDVTFTAPSGWGEIVEYYAPALGLDFPAGAFGAGYYASVDDYYGIVTISDPTADFDAFKAAMDPILQAAGYTLDEEYSVGGTYSWYKGDVYFDYTYYTPEETGTPDIYPQGMLYVDILDMSSYY